MKINPNFSDISKRDFQLVIEALSGSQKAYSDILKNYKGLVYFMLIKMVKNKRDAEELTIEVFEKAFIKLHQYKSDYAFCTWLFKIGRNCGLDYLRRKAKERFVSIDNPDEVPDLGSSSFMVSDIQNPEEEYMSQQKEEMMHKVVNKLKPHYRKLVIMHYFKEYTFNEITEQLDIPLGTVKNRMFRSREILAHKLRTYKLRM